MRRKTDSQEERRPPPKPYPRPSLGPQPAPLPLGLWACNLTVTHLPKIRNPLYLNIKDDAVKMLHSICQHTRKGQLGSLLDGLPSRPSFFLRCCAVATKTHAAGYPQSKQKEQRDIQGCSSLSASLPFDSCRGGFVVLSLGIWRSLSHILRVVKTGCFDHFFTL